MSLVCVILFYAWSFFFRRDSSSGVTKRTMPQFFASALLNIQLFAHDGTSVTCRRCTRVTSQRSMSVSCFVSIYGQCRLVTREKVVLIHRSWSGLWLAISNLPSM
ncbi:hypothetical protein BKA83DRAFT_2126660 [Pisolithus microcarpus]|nr:hypothetical protein BKA83DRAFT_2126660 [Pisolithus microcarpus]